MSLPKTPQSARQCALAAVALARAAEADDPIGQTAWDQMSTDEQSGVMFVLALWVAQLREGLGIPWTMLLNAAEGLPDRGAPPMD